MSWKTSFKYSIQNLYKANKVVIKKNKFKKG